MTRLAVQLELRDANARRHWRRAAVGSAAVAGAFSAVIALALLVAFVRDVRSNPLASPEMTELKARLAANPKDAAAQAAYREADHRVRRTFFERRRFIAHGAVLLAGGLAVMVAAMKVAATLAATPYVPVGARPAEDESTGRLVRLAAAYAGGVFLVVWLGIGLVSRRAPLILAEAPPPAASGASGPEMRPTAGGGPAAAAAEREAPLPDEHFARNWPMFRGPDGSARAQGTGYPIDWDGPSGKNILWKVKVPLPGHNSPVVWDDRIFLAGGTAERRAISCFDAAKGTLLWTTDLPKAKPTKVTAESGHTPSTLATDGRRVFGIFPDGHLAAIDFAGKPAWSKELGVPENAYGHASSLLVAGGTLVVQFDQGGHGEPSGKATVYAFDCATGREVWKATGRPVPASWATPVVARTASGPQVIVAADPWVVGYDLATGRELWKASCMGGEVCPSPVVLGDRVFVGTDNASFNAIRLDGAGGDVTSSHVAWKHRDDLPDVVSPAAADGLVWTVSSSSYLNCFDAATGKVLHQQELEGTYHASPVVAEGRVYLIDREGVARIFEASKEYKELATPKLGEAVDASPAFVGGRIYVRGGEHLFCIGTARP